jgi:hypothetical protein
VRSEKEVIDTIKDILHKFARGTGESSVIENGEWTLVTNGWAGDTSLHKFLHPDLAKLLDNLDEDDGDFYNNHIYSHEEAVDFIQQDVKDPKAKKVADEEFPGIFTINTNDEEFEQWKEGLSNDLDNISRTLNRADEQATRDAYYNAVMDYANARLGETFDVDSVNWEQVILRYKIYDIINNIDFDTAIISDDDFYANMEYYLDEYFPEHHQSMFDFNERRINYYGSFSDTIKHSGLSYIE